MKPMFKHDCTECTHIGTVQIKGEYHDLYSCPKGLRGTTLVARWSDHGPDYHSTHVGDVDPLYSAAGLRIAKIAHEGEYYQKA